MKACELVHYVIPAGPSKGEHRPAFIVKVWNDDTVNLQVLMDGGNDIDANFPAMAGGSNTRWVTSAHLDPAFGLGTFHYPES